MKRDYQPDRIDYLRPIIVDGPDGVGKTTMVRMLKERLQAKGFNNVVTLQAVPEGSMRDLLLVAYTEQWENEKLFGVLMTVHNAAALAIAEQIELGNTVIMDRGPLSVAHNLAKLNHDFESADKIRELYDAFNPLMVLLLPHGEKEVELVKRRIIERGTVSAADQVFLDQMKAHCGNFRDLFARRIGGTIQSADFDDEVAIDHVLALAYGWSHLEDPVVDEMRSLVVKGQSHSDRTGVGRISLAGGHLRFPLYREVGGIEYPVVPMPTSRKLNFEPIVNELLWMMSGSTNIFRAEKPVKIWREWALSPETFNKFTHLLDDYFLSAYFPELVGQTLTTEQQEEVTRVRNIVEAAAKSICTEHAGEIGNLYGAMWRMADNNIDPESPFAPLYMHLSRVPFEEIPSDTLAVLRAEYDRHLESMGERAGDVPSFEQAASDIYNSRTDQFGKLVRNLKRDPFSSRMVVDAWNVAAMPIDSLAPDVNVLLNRTALTACHNNWQVVVSPDGAGKPAYLTMIVNIRSSDVAIGLRTNVAFYAVLAHMLAREAGLMALELVVNQGDYHLYSNHLDGVAAEMARPVFHSPILELNDEVKSIFDYTLKDVSLKNYVAGPAIKYPIAV